MPTRLAARKWPSSWTNTSTPRTNANDRSVIKTAALCLQFYRACDFVGLGACPPVDRPNLCQRIHLSRAVRIHAGANDLRNCGKRQPSLEKARDRNLVGRVEHDRQTPFLFERPVCQAKCREHRGIRHLELE